MPFLLKQLILSTTFNISLLVVLMVGIQNSTNKSRVNLYGIETINLPIGFIVGSSFLCGSLFGSLCNVIDFHQKKDEY
tara:strand:- start:75 stop:308 length:234 start_codon:yes stop_codon:yes gene_type:complete